MIRPTNDKNGPRSTALFLLRVNTGFFEASEVTQLTARLKISSLMYERMLVEDGLYTIQIVNQGWVTTTSPADNQEEVAKLLRTWREMGDAARRVSLPTRPTDSAYARWAPIFDAPLLATYYSTFREILPAALPWVAWLKDVDLGSGATPIGNLLLPAEHDPFPADLARGVGRGLGNTMLQHNAVRNLNFGLFLAKHLQSSLSTDRIHAELARDKARHSPLPRVEQLDRIIKVPFPHLAKTPWDAIADARKDASISALRAAVTQVAETLSSTSSPTDDQIGAHWDELLNEAYSSARPSLLDLGVDTAVSTVLNLSSLPLGWPVGVIVSTVVPILYSGARFLAARVACRKVWVPLYFRLRKLGADEDHATS